MKYNINVTFIIMIKRVIILLTFFSLSFPFALLASNNAPVIDATSKGSLNNTQSATHVTTATTNSYDTYQQQNTTSADIKELRGALEVQGHQLQLLEQSQKEFSSQIEQLKNQVNEQSQEITKLKGQKSAPNSHKDFNVTTTTSTSKNTNTSTSTSSVNKEVSTDEQAYALATTQIKNKEYKKATASLTGFLNTYPQSKYRPSAHYWLAQLYLNDERLSLAKSQFSDVLSYSDKTRKPNALLKLANIAIMEKDEVKAKQYYQQVVSQYPNTEQSTTAKKELAKLH